MALPVVLWQGWAFIQPALMPTTRSRGLAVVWWGTVCFGVGAAFAYTVLLPLFLTFLLSIGHPALEPVISINRYLGFVIGMLVICGALFELPLAIVFLTRAGVVTPKALRLRRRWAVLAMVVVSAFLTPTTDAVSLGLMTLPLLALYEVSILLSSWSSPRPDRAPLARAPLTLQTPEHPAPRHTG